MNSRTGNWYTILRRAGGKPTSSGWWVLLTITCLCCGRSGSTSDDRDTGASSAPNSATQSSTSQETVPDGSDSASAATEGHTEEATVVRPPCTFVLRCSAVYCDVMVRAPAVAPRSAALPGKRMVDLRCDPMADEHRRAVLETMADLIGRGGGNKRPDATSHDFQIRMYFDWHGTMVMRWAAVLRRSSWWRHAERWQAVSWRGIDSMFMENRDIFSEYDAFLSARGYQLKEVRIDKVGPVAARHWFDPQHRLEELGYLPNDLVVIPSVVDLVFAPAARLDGGM